MQLFATFVKNKCNFFNFLLLQKLALVTNNVSEMFPLIRDVAAAPQTSQLGGPRPTLGPKLV